MDDHAADDPVREPESPDEPYDDQQGVPSPRRPSADAATT